MFQDNLLRLSSEFSLFSVVALMAILLAALIFDLRKRRIPNSLVLAGLALAIVLAIPAGWQGLGRLMLGALSGFFIFFPVYFWGAMGAGDVKLISVVGAFLGMHHLLFAVALILLAGGALALIYLKLGPAFVNQKQLPYAVSIFAGVATHLFIYS